MCWLYQLAVYWKDEERKKDQFSSTEYLYYWIIVLKYHFPTKKKKKSELLEEMANSRSERELYKMSLEQVVTPDNQLWTSETAFVT